MSVPSGPLLIVERFEALVQGRGLWHVTALSSPKSKTTNLGKSRCRTPKSRPEVENRAILTLRLRVFRRRLLRDRTEPAGGHAAGHAEVEIGRSGGARLGQHARRGRPLDGGVVAGPEDERRAVAQVERQTLAAPTTAARCAPAAAAAPRRRRPARRACARRPRARSGSWSRRMVGRSSSASTPVSTIPPPDTGRPVPVDLERGDRPVLEHLDREPVREVGVHAQPGDRREAVDHVVEDFLAHVERGHVARRALERRRGCAPRRSSSPR